MRKRRTKMPHMGFWFLPLLLFMGCKTAQVGIATQQKWYGGVEGSGGGVHYTVEVSKPQGLVLTVEQAWFGERDKGWVLPTKVLIPGSAILLNNKVAGKGVKNFRVVFEQIIPDPLRGSQVPPRPSVQPFDHPPTDLPQGFTHGAVLFYKTSRGSGTWIIEDFTDLTPIAYP